MRVRLIIPVLLAGFLGLLPAHSEDSARQAIEKALPYLEEEGTWWIEKKDCVSCHHTSFFVWAKDLALEQGFAIDRDTLDGQREWMWNSFLEEIEADPDNPDSKPKPGEVKGDRNVEGVSQFLVSASQSAAPEEVIQRLVEVVKSNQGENGHWSPGGQLPRQERSKTETQWASNQWAELALAAHGEEPERKTETWKEGVPAVTSEWWMLNLLLRPSNPHSLKNLLDRQKEDGGWSWKTGEPSDPSGTGQALIALGRAGKTGEHAAAVARARQFLVETQDEEGHWKTLNTKDRSDATRVSNFWGTAWAVIGLLESSASEVTGD